MISELNTEEKNIMTIEDPVEYVLPRVNQIQVNPAINLNFADILRSVVRHDPDIVMVGEIRDNDTAKTAMQAALTGHLVLSTFHASSAAAALTRLMDLIGENPLFLSAIRLIMAQRLVRKLDDASKIAYKPDERTLTIIQNVINGLPTHVPKPDLTNLQLFQPGKTEANPYGFTGQIAIREQFMMVGPVVELLQTNKLLTTQQIEAAAVQSGMLTMLQNGVLKAIAGETSIAEVYRVVG